MFLHLSLFQKYDTVQETAVAKQANTPISIVPPHIQEITLLPQLSDSCAFADTLLFGTKISGS